MQLVANPTAPTRVTNLSINSDLLNQAKALRINLSATLEEALTVAIREKQRQQWLQDNQESIEQFNQRIGSDGCFSDSLRSF